MASLECHALPVAVPGSNHSYNGLFFAFHAAFSVNYLALIDMGCACTVLKLILFNYFLD